MHCNLRPSEVAPVVLHLYEAHNAPAYKFSKGGSKIEDK